MNDKEILKQCIRDVKQAWSECLVYVDYQNSDKEAIGRITAILLQYRLFNQNDKGLLISGVVDFKNDLERLIEMKNDYLKTLESENPEEYWRTDRQMAEYEIDKFLDWIKNG